MRNDGKAVASMVLGIISVVLLFVPLIGFVGLITAVVGLILGISSKNEIRQSQGELSGEGMATAGMVMSIICIALFLISLVACGALLSSF